MQELRTSAVICQGGLDSNQNWHQLSNQAPGAATTLVNFEPSLFGGYRRINGYMPLEDSAPEVDPDNAEGPILGVFIYNNDTILAARKEQGSNTYAFYEWSPSGNWIKLDTSGITLNSSQVTKVRYDNFNFDGTPKIIFVDGVNNATIYDGTNWTQIKSTNDGSTYENAGGGQAIDAPSFVKVFENHIFIAGGSIVSHSAPLSEYDWTSGNGAGQLPAGFEVMQIYPFRETNYVFGFNRIKKISVAGTEFVLNDVTTDIGCIASDSVVEINADLIFLSQDGFRPISATERIGDVELGSISKNIQQDVIDLVNLFPGESVDAVVLRRKSQVRFFFSTGATPNNNARGIIGGLKGGPQGSTWEWGELKGIKVSCATSGYLQENEFVLHGGYDGKVYRQEVGSSFNGENIYAVYATPFLDFGDPLIRKTIHNVTLFTRPEGPVTISSNLRFDWNRNEVYNPATFFLESTGDIAIYGEAVYGDAVYGGAAVPVMVTNALGSGFATQLILHTNGTESPYTVQSFVYEYEVNGRK